MRINHYVYRLLGAVCAFATIACVDQSFDLNDISKEVTVGSGKTTLPIGYIEDKTIGDLLEGQEIDGLTIDENGNLSFSYEGNNETINIDSISTEFEIPQIESSFEVDYPSFSLDLDKITIEAFESINISGLDNYPGTSFTIPNGVSIPISGSYSKVFDDDNLNLAFDVPEQVKSINKIYFRDSEGGHNGAPLNVHVDFNGLEDINGGGTLTFDFNIDGGTFRILNAEDSLIYEGKRYADNINIAAGTKSLDFIVYIESIAPKATIDENHHMEIPLEFSYNMSFDLTTKGGNADLSKLPIVTLISTFEYSDAEIAINADANLIDYAVEGGNPIEISNLPEQLKMVNRVSMLQNDNSILHFFAEGMEWLGETAENIEIAVGLPNYLKLHSINGEDYKYNEATCELETTVAQLSKGINIAIEALDFGTNGLTPNEDGKIALDFAPTIKANFKEGAVLNVSDLEYDDKLKLKVGIEESRLAIESFSGKVDYSYNVNQEFAITGLGDLDLDLEIEGIGLKPIIEVYINHPLTLTTTLSGSITPSTDGVVNEANAITFDNVELKAATYNNGLIENANMTLIIADESLRTNYADEKYTFVACDVTKLICGSIPDTLNIELSLSVDPEQMQTLYISESLSITYGYKLDLPFAIDNSLKVSYSDEIGDLNSLFSQLAEYDIEVGDVALIATITNTTPLQLAANATLKDAEGNATEAQVAIAGDGMIEGSADGKTPQVSVLRFELKLGEDGKVANIGNVDAVAFELEATSAAGESLVALNTDQYLGVKLQVELDGGITVDLDKLNM